MTAKLSLFLAGLLGAIGVAAAAFHAHGLEKMLAERFEVEPDDVAQRLVWCETAARYSIYHALALLGLGVWASRDPGVGLALALGLFLLGVLAFCGGLFALVVMGADADWEFLPKYVAPGGGIALIVAWLLTGILGLAASTDPY